MTMRPDAEKSRLRTIARERRAEAHRTAGPRAGERLRDNFIAAAVDMGVPPPGAAVSAYWPFGSEMDVRPLFQHLRDLGYVCALPVVVARHRPLVFRRWEPGAAFEDGPIGTVHPGAGHPEMRPDLVLTPLLAFDADGYRLGQGGGYYDRTLALLRSTGEVLAVGIAYSAQKTETLPRSAHDQPLDWVVTEEAVTRFQAAKRTEST